MRRFPYESSIGNVSVDGWEYTTEESNKEFCIIRIGNAEREVEGDQQFVVHYTFTYPDDRLEDFDYLFHTVLGTEFEEEIEHVAFHIVFDKPLPDDIGDRLELYAGEYGKTEGVIPGLNVTASPTEIAGEASNIHPRHGITLYARLPAGYYQGTATVNHALLYIFLAATILTILAICYILPKYKKQHVTKVIEFYPPEGVCSAEVGTIIDDSVDTVDITSLIPWLAGQGYIGVKEVKKGKLFKRTDLELTKLKELPDSAPSYQRRMMRLLFKDDQSVVCIKEIGENPQEIKRIKADLRKHFSDQRQLTELKWSSLLYVLLAFVGSVALGFNNVVKTFDDDVFYGAAAFFGLPCFFAAVTRVVQAPKDPMYSSTRRILMILLRALLMLLTWAGYCYFVIEYDAPLQPWAVLIIYVVCFILNEQAGRFNTNSRYRMDLMGRLMGFKEFIQTAEQPQLEQLQTDDPHYFYKVLPYAMVFGLSKKWANLFKDIEVEQPSWYESSSRLMGSDLRNNLVNNFTSTAGGAISTISHSSSSSGGSGGGGFSGGGGGGGGGGSW